jgi:hypothetical protein
MVHAYNAKRSREEDCGTRLACERAAYLKTKAKGLGMWVKW